MINSINKSKVISGLIDIKQVIESRLKQLSEEAAVNGAVNRTTIHTDAEKFFEDFLNELYGWQLKNANAEKQNAPGVDLIYKGERIVVQVSNKSTKDKVVESLKKTPDEYKEGGFRFILVTMQLRHTAYQEHYAEDFNKVKGGLDFDCHNDVIDVTSLIKEVNNSSPEKVWALKKVVDAYFERAQARKDLGLKKLGFGKARNLFEFNSGSVGFFGRENEMERLRAFVSGDDPFRWYAIAAPGGAGKTRLAYELQNELEKTGWTCLEIKGENVWKQLGELDGLYPGKTLFIADYVAPHTKELGEWMKKLSQPGSAREPLRLLLLERDTKDEYGRVAWFESLLSADRADIPLCGPDSPEMLRPLGDEYLLGLIRGFSETAVKAAREEGQECRPLEDGEERRIREKLDSIDKNLVRPFYAMLLTDAWVRDPEAPKWKQKDLLGYVTNRERDIIKKRIEGAGVHATEQLVQAVCRIWMAATVLGAGSPVASDKLYEAFRPEFDLVKRSAERKADLLDSIELAPHESLLQAAGIFSDGNIIPILPDILGEFFVLTGVDEPVFRQRLWAAALDEFDSSLEFFKRLLKDFGQMMAEDDGLRRRVFPEDPRLDDRKTQRYARLLRLLFEEPNDRPVREAPKKTLVALADGRQGNTDENRVIWSDAGSVCRDMGEHGRALGFLLKFVKASEESCGGEDTETASAYNNIAQVYQAMGDYDRALKFNLKALKVMEKALGAEHPSTAATYNNIASLYQDMGDYDKALDYNLKGLAVLEKTLGIEHPSTATAYNNIAQVYQAMGDYDKTLEFNLKALKVREKVLGAEHPSTATTYNNIAGVYQDMGDYDKALEFNLKALKVREKVLGAEHPDTAVTYNNIASLYQAMGDYDKALEFNLKALKVREKALGAEHPDTATTYNNIASLYQAMGDYDKALEYFNKALGVVKKVLGEEHPHTSTTYNNIARVYQDTGEYDKALEFILKALKVREKVLGAEHPSTAETYNNIAGVYYAMGDYDKALEYYEKALAVREKALGGEHPSTATTYNNIAGVYYAMGDFDKALEFNLKALKVKEKALCTDHPSTAVTYVNIGALRLKQNNRAEAVKYLTKACDVFDKKLGPGHPNTKLARQWLDAALKLPSD